MFSTTVLGQVFLNGISLSAIYVLIALGFTLLFGIMKVVNFAHGAFAMLGGYALYYLYGVLGWPYLPAILLSALGVATAGLVLEVLVFRWFYQKMFQSMIGLLGLNFASSCSMFTNARSRRLWTASWCSATSSFQPTGFSSWRSPRWSCSRSGLS
jgi:branched-subunit amino acid ABC-type transport system permease component